MRQTDYLLILVTLLQNFTAKYQGLGAYANAQHALALKNKSLLVSDFLSSSFYYPLVGKQGEFESQGLIDKDEVMIKLFDLSQEAKLISECHEFKCDDSHSAKRDHIRL